MLWGWTFKAFKRSGNWGYLIKRPSGRQSDKILPLDCNLNELNATHNMKHGLIISARSYSNIYYQISQVDCFRRVPLCVLWKFMFRDNLRSVCFHLVNMAVVPLSSPKRDKYFVFCNCILLLNHSDWWFFCSFEVPLSHKYNPASPAVNGTDYAPSIH